jgi:hypothetical protein
VPGIYSGEKMCFLSGAKDAGKLYDIKEIIERDLH